MTELLAEGAGMLARLVAQLAGWLDWLATAPRGGLLAGGAVLSTLVVLALRRWGTTAALRELRRGDRRRLRAWADAARAGGDHAELERCRRVLAAIDRAEAREGTWALVSALGLAVLLGWGGTRLWGWRPIGPGELVGFELRVTPSPAGETVHLLPTPGVEALDAPVQRLSVAGGRASARWRLRRNTASSRDVLRVRLGERVLSHEVVWLRPGTGALRRGHGPGVETRLAADAYRPLGVIPARLPLGIAGWGAWWGTWSLATWLVWRAWERREERRGEVGK
ncbi:MAG: hypothetical protein ACKOGA_11260 [Planctomycetaceae bacterium]